MSCLIVANTNDIMDEAERDCSRERFDPSQGEAKGTDEEAGDDDNHVADEAEITEQESLLLQQQSQGHAAEGEYVQQEEDDEEISWRGVPLANLNCNLRIENPHFRSHSNRMKSTCFVRWPPDSSKLISPYPDPKKSQDKWDEHHVRMPCSNQSYFPVENKEKKSKVLKKRWKLIIDALSDSIKSTNELEQKVLSYNNLSNHSFGGLHEYFEEHCEEEECNIFFDQVLPEIVIMCRKITSVVTQPIPLLKRGMNHSLTFSQTQIASLLANAFFCTFPKRNVIGKSAQYGSYPPINFSKLFSSHMGHEYQIEKYKCIFNYFRRMINKHPSEESLITFRRKCIPYNMLPKWSESEATFPNLHIDSKGTIEDNALGMLQVDFANAFIGGGVLGHGCVQEEIRFVLSPELIAAKLFTEKLSDNECLIMTGFERFSNYDGYGSTFKFTGNHEDPTPRDENSRHIKSCLVAIDALYFASDTKSQYTRKSIIRELNKAYIGFHSDGQTNPASIGTGNWGCGAFRGDPYLKSLIQLMAAAEAGRDVAYFTFGDKKLRDSIFDIYALINSKKITVGKLFSILIEYLCNAGHESYDIPTHIYAAVSYDEDTDEDLTMEVDEISPKRARFSESDSPVKDVVDIVNMDDQITDDKSSDPKKLTE